MSDEPKGTYLLILHMKTSVSGLQIGKLGQFDFDAGYYLYVGSAFGPGGLRARTAHHQQRTRPRPHWHIDYLRPHTHLREIWAIACPQRLEPIWSTALMSVSGVQVPVQGFGASDTATPSHLFHTPVYPPARVLSRLLIRPLLARDSPYPSIRIEIDRFASES
jgi:Uri superfamily endonuclease